MPAPNGAGPNCAGTDTETWFSTNLADVAWCLRICAACPIRQECLAAALARDEQWGIWGGQQFSPRWVAAHVYAKHGTWIVRGWNVFGLPTLRAGFRRREDAEACRTQLLTDSYRRASMAANAPRSLTGRWGLCGTDAA
jgi:hypothetical protein